MSKDKTEEPEYKTPEWLKVIQLNSWEAELLVSALVLYALFQVPTFLTEFHLRNFERGSQLHRFFGLLRSSVELLKYGYIFHILVRGLWVASVGLSYVFPRGIDTERLKFKGRFAKELNHKKSLVSNVLRLEELSSLFYGISFMGFGVILGVGTLLFTFTLLSDAMGRAFVDSSSMVLFYFFVFLIYFILIVLVLIDFVTNGLFRKIDWMAKWFYPVAVVFRVITLSFLYRRSLLVLISNIKGWKSNLIPFAIIIVCGGFMYLRGEARDKQTSKYLHLAEKVNVLNENYENLRDEKDSPIATIQSDIISENALRLFIDDLGWYSNFYKTGHFKSKTTWKELESDSASFYLNKWVSIKVDSTAFTEIQWFKTQHRSTLDFGFMTYLDISTIPRGAHNLSIRIDTTYLNNVARRNIENSIFHQLQLANVYFFYDK